MPYVSPSHLNSILFESRSDDNWEDFLHRQEGAVRDEMHSLAGLGKEKGFWEKVLEAVKNLMDGFHGRVSEGEELNEGIKDALIGLTVAGLKVPEGLLKMFDIGVNFITAIPAWLSKGDPNNMDTSAFKAFLVATVGGGMANQAMDVFQYPDNEVTMAVKLIWGMAFVIGAIRGILRMKLDTASFIRNIRRSLNKMRDEPADIEVTKAPSRLDESIDNFSQQEFDDILNKLFSKLPEHTKTEHKSKWSNKYFDREGHYYKFSKAIKDGAFGKGSKIRGYLDKHFQWASSNKGRKHSFHANITPSLSEHSDTDLMTIDLDFDTEGLIRGIYVIRHVRLEPSVD